VRRSMWACLGLVAVASSVAVAPLAATAAVTGRQATSAAATAPPVAVAVEGSNGALWVQAPQLSSGWHSLGGKIIGPPAVVTIPGTSTPLEPLFIAVGTNDALWARTLTVGWHPLGGSTCYAVGAADTSGSLTAACLGLYDRLWTYNTADVTGCSGLPCFTTTPTDFGGVLTAGPAVTPFGYYLVLGEHGEIYISDGNAANGFTGTPWRCIGPPGASGYATAAGETTIFACQGTNHALWTASQSTETWSSAVSLGGVLISGPAIAATSSVTEFFVVGTNHAVWERTPTSGWASLGGYAVGGVAAVALTNVNGSS